MDIDEQVVRPAGKALNVSYALAWMGRPSVAAGLWGRDDHAWLRRSVRAWGGLIQTKMTTVSGRTRQNVTVVDTLSRREMHLRVRSELASRPSLRRLAADLTQLVRAGDTCVFAGAMPGGQLLAAVVDVVQRCHDLGARIVLDTHGSALKALAEAGLPGYIAPNVAELGELLGRDVPDAPAKLAVGARGLMDGTGTVLISRGARGAVLVTERGAWKGRLRTQGEVVSTVGCGDYLLAGFLAGLAGSEGPAVSLALALKVAAARAWAWTESRTWSQAERDIAVDVQPVSG
jgi:1-phosphofructokinase family hexose kinase